MRIARLDLLAYGHHRDTPLDLSRPDAGLTVVCGPNEAGKSTAMRALLAVLFGFPRTVQDAHVHGRYGLRIGARLVGTGNQELAFVRQSLSRSPLLDGAGQPLEEGQLQGFLGGVDRQLYVRMFSVDHDELRTHSDELLDSDGEIGRLVFGASLGSGSVASVLQRLDDRADKLYKDRGSAQLVTGALNRHRDAMKSARDLRVRSREWDRRLSAVTDAEAKADGLRSDLQSMRIEYSRLSWVQTALPLIAQRSEFDLRLQSLEGEGAIPSNDWAIRARSAQERIEAARLKDLSASTTHETLAGRIAAITVRTDLVERGAQIDKLVQGVDRYEKDANDLGERRGQLDEARKTLSVILAQLGLGADDGRLIAESELATVEELAQVHSALGSLLTGVQAELSKLNTELETATRELEAHPEPRGVAALSRALVLAKPIVPRDEALSTEQQELFGLQNEAKARAGRLGLGTRDLVDVEALQVPTVRQIADEQARRQAVATRNEQIEEREAELTAQRVELDAQIASLASKPGVPDPDRVQAAREHRDAGWDLIRQTLETGHADENAAAGWAGRGPLPVAYEGAVEEADLAADARYEHAEDLTSIIQCRSLNQDVTDELQRLADSRARLEGEASLGTEAWKQLWLSIGVTASDPSEMTAWREEHQQLLSMIGDIGKKERFLSSERETIATHVEALRTAITELDFVPDSSKLGHLVVQADEIIANALEQNEARRAAAAALQRATSSLPERTKAVADQEDGLDTWEVSWSSALVLLQLEPSVRPPAALPAVRAYRALPGARQEVRGFESRIQGIDRDLGDFSRRVFEVAAGLNEIAGRDPLDVVEELRSELGKARLAVSARDTLDSQLGDASDALRASTLELRNAQEALAAIRTEVSLPPDAELSSVIERVHDADELKDKIGQIEGNLIAQGSGRSLEQVLMAVSEVEMDGDQLAAAVAALDDDIVALDATLGEANRTLGEATRDLEEVTAASTAADVEQDALTELALAGDLAAEYAQTAVSAAILRKVISNYGERHRGPMLDRASRLFSRLTDGAFVQLIPETLGDRQILLAKRRNDELLTTAALSDGTRDELYLALRIAGIEYELDHLAEPLPVLFDDVLVNFDDPRSSAALEVLAELGERTQVILFTHHESVVSAAQGALAEDHLGVVHLEARDHSLPLVAAVDTGQSDFVRSSIPREGDEASSEAVLEALRTAGRPLPKADLVGASLITDQRWSSVIRSLLDSGQVVQEGTKRGAKYRLP